MKPWFNGHTHTMFSNTRLLDAIGKPKDIIKTAKSLGLSGLCITDHEILSSHMDFQEIAEELKKQGDSFKIALGNEIYLVNARGMGQTYWHFLLMAKNSNGHKALRELSSNAWYHSYWDKRMERVPTLKSELAEAATVYKGDLIATTACRGSELATLAFEMAMARKKGDDKIATNRYNKIVSFMKYILPLFGEDFYIECAPSDDPEQILINQTLRNIAKAFGVKMTTATDVHYLRPEDKKTHKMYLTSKEGSRETDAFYKYTYMMSYDEVKELLLLSFEEDFVEEILQNTLEIQNKIDDYSLFHKQFIPTVEVKNYPKKQVDSDFLLKYPNLSMLYMSDDIYYRYWVNQCIDKLHELNKYNTTYLQRLEEEARVKKIVGDKLETNMFCYPITLQHYIDIMWACGSTIGVGRGSSCSGLNHYLLGVTQLDPIEWGFPFFRYLNEERVELGSLLLILPSCKKRTLTIA